MWLPRRLVLFLLSLLLLAGRSVLAAETPVRATVYVFLSETCPICQSYTLTLRELHQQYAAQGIRFVGVFPADNVQPTDVILFRKHYQVPFELRIDEDQQLTRRFHARITPEVIVVAADGQTIAYQGRIDDSYFRLGQRRTVTTTHELADALAAVAAGRAVAQPRTEAVGCFINVRTLQP